MRGATIQKLIDRFLNESQPLLKSDPTYKNGPSTQGKYRTDVGTPFDDIMPFRLTACAHAGFVLHLHADVSATTRVRPHFRLRDRILIISDR